MRVKVLGSAAGGGFPQWNCACPNCSGLRSGGIKARPRTQAQVVVTLNQSAWFLLNASPDLRQQILATPELSVTSVSLASPISTILLTSADVDCVMGLLHLREFQPLHIYSTLSVRRILTEEKSLFYAPSVSGLGDNWLRSVDECDLALLDGTFWKDDELIAAKRSRRTARDMGHLPLWGERGMLKRPFRLGKTKRVIIHINNTNPVLNEESPEHRAVREAGWEIAYDGMEFNL